MLRALQVMSVCLPLGKGKVGLKKKKKGENCESTHSETHAALLSVSLAVGFLSGRPVTVTRSMIRSLFFFPPAFKFALLCQSRDH